MAHRFRKIWHDARHTLRIIWALASRNAPGVVRWSCTLRSPTKKALQFQSGDRRFHLRFAIQIIAHLLQ